jgi:hypothetical protein
LPRFIALPVERRLNSHLPISAAPSDVSSNGPQNAAIPDKHQIELVTIPRMGTDMDKRTKRANPLRENEKPTLLIRQQIILASGVAMAGTIPFRPGDVRAVVASRR